MKSPDSLLHPASNLNHPFVQLYTSVLYMLPAPQSLRSLLSQGITVLLFSNPYSSLTECQDAYIIHLTSSNHLGIMSWHHQRVSTVQ